MVVKKKVTFMMLVPSFLVLGLIVLAEASSCPTCLPGDFPAPCWGPSITQEQLVALYPAGGSGFLELGEFQVAAWNRTCNPATGCSDWTDYATSNVYPTSFYLYVYIAPTSAQFQAFVSNGKCPAGGVCNYNLGCAGVNVPYGSNLAYPTTMCDVGSNGCIGMSVTNQGVTPNNGTLTGDCASFASQILDDGTGHQYVASWQLVGLSPRYLGPLPTKQGSVKIN